MKKVGFLSGLENDYRLKMITIQFIIQLINKSITLYTKPEENLKDDKFSPYDIRTLTYLGYLILLIQNIKY